VEVKVADKLAVVTGRVIAYKAMEFLRYSKLIKHSAYNSPLGSTSIVSIEVVEGD
jgi:hypothetical protein